MVCRTNEIYNVALNKGERNSLWHVSRRGSSVQIYNSAALSKQHFDRYPLNNAELLAKNLQQMPAKERCLLRNATLNTMKEDCDGDSNIDIL